MRSCIGFVVLLLFPTFLIGKSGQPFHGTPNGCIDIGFISSSPQTIDFMQHVKIGSLVDDKAR